MSLTDVCTFGLQRDSTDSPAPSLQGSQALAERVAQAADQHQRELADENDRLRRALAEQRHQQENAQALPLVRSLMFERVLTQGACADARGMRTCLTRMMLPLLTAEQRLQCRLQSCERLSYLSRVSGRLTLMCT